MPSPSGCSRWFSAASGLMLTLIGLICTGGGVMMAIHSSQEKINPRQVTLQQLIEQGKTDNPLVIVNDFQLVDDLYAVQEKEKDKRWLTLLIPVVPSGESEDPKSIKVLLESGRVANEEQLQELMKQKSIAAKVTDGTGYSLLKLKKLLRKNNPDIDVEHCLVLEHKPDGHTPTSPIFGLLCAAPFFVVALVGLGMTWRAIRPSAGSASVAATNFSPQPPPPGGAGPAGFDSPQMPASATGYLTDVMIYRGWLAKGLSAGRGVIILRPGFVAFLPTERSKHLAELALQGVETAVLPWTTIVLSGKASPEAWLDQLRHQPEQFDREIAATALAAHGVALHWPNVDVIHKKVWFQGAKRGLWFNGPDGVSLRAGTPLSPAELAYAESFYRSARGVAR